MDINKLTGHTPGPWLTPESFRGDLPVYARNQKRSYIALVNTERPDWKENAEVIQASPDLLELAKLGLDLAEACIGAEGDKPLVPMDVYRKARALKEKAGYL